MILEEILGQELAVGLNILSVFVAQLGIDNAQAVCECVRVIARLAALCRSFRYGGGELHFLFIDCAVLAEAFFDKLGILVRDKLDVLVVGGLNVEQRMGYLREVGLVRALFLRPEQGYFVVVVLDTQSLVVAGKIHNGASARDGDGDTVGDICGSGDSEAALREGRLEVLVDVVHRYTDIDHNCSP